MNPGKLNKRIKIITLGDGVDSDGFPVEGVETVVRDTWASIRSLRGKEFFEASQVQSKDTKVFNFRYFKGLEEDMTIKYDGKSYNIYSINNLYERNTEYEVYAKEVSASG